MTHLFEPFKVRGVTLRNRIGVSPMCQYSSRDGLAGDWHLVHLGARAAGGAGLVIAEATAVEERGRITPDDLGLWDDGQIGPLRKVTDFIRRQGAVPGIQIAHAGRKASTRNPWKPSQSKIPRLDPDEGGWEAVGPGERAFSPDYPVPRPLLVAEIDGIIQKFAEAAVRARQAGFEWLEIHSAHGYLLHSFLSPLSNDRTDEYGGTPDNRMRIVLRTAEAVRAVWPEELPLTVRLSCTDWVEGGWTLEDSVELSRRLAVLGVDLIDCSSGGLVPNASIKPTPGYQVPFAKAIRREAGIPTAAVGLITEPAQADAVVREGKADLVLLARQMLREPQWPYRAAKALNHPEPVLPPQYSSRV